MKLSSLYFGLLFVSATCICGMCSKSGDDKAPDKPIELKHSTGFLVTIGVNGQGAVDSVCLRYGPAQPVTEYSQGMITGGGISRPKHTWQISNAGANQWHIKYNDGRYLGYELNPYSIYAYDKYSIKLDNDPTARNLFVMNISDDKFFIQPVDNKNVYLNTVPSRGQPPSPRHTGVEFKDSKQMWFIMP